MITAATNTIPVVKIVENAMLTIPGPTQTVPRTWRERLFSCPWRPLKRTRTVSTTLPSPVVHRYGNTMVAHPVVVRKLLDHMGGKS